MNFERRCMDLVERIGDLLLSEGVEKLDFMITERPAFFSSERGQVAAHQNYTIDLAAIAFYVAGWYHMDHRRHFAITANQWKGSVPKEVTARRFFRDFPHAKAGELSEHAIDAMMLHRFWLTEYAVHSRLAVRGSSPEALQLLA